MYYEHKASFPKTGKNCSLLANYLWNLKASNIKHSTVNY